MQPSMFNVRVPLEDRGEVFLMNTFTDAQIIVSRDVADLLDRIAADGVPGKATVLTWRPLSSWRKRVSPLAESWPS